MHLPIDVSFLPDLVSSTLSSMSDSISHLSFFSDASDFADSADYSDSPPAPEPAETPGGDEDHKQRLAEYAKSMEGMVDKKTAQVDTMVYMLGIPLVVIGGFLIVKIVYDLFTKAADKVAAGVESSSLKLKSAARKIGTTNGQDEPEPQKKSQRRPMLFGEIIRRFVNTTVSEADVEKAVARQKESSRSLKLGEILVEQGVITGSDVNQALKIQQKAKQG